MYMLYRTCRRIFPSGFANGVFCLSIVFFMVMNYIDAVTWRVQIVKLFIFNTNGKIMPYIHDSV
jgi:hypothetical protein